MTHDAEPMLRDDEFLRAEYHEAATSYANGVEIGFSTTKAFFAINGVLITVQQTPLELVGNSEIVRYLQSLAPFFGIIVSVVLGLFVSLYFKHLNNCLNRCCAIEEIYGGQLFSGNRAVAGKVLNTQTILFVFAVAGCCVWIYLLYISRS